MISQSTPQQQSSNPFAKPGETGRKFAHGVPLRAVISFESAILRREWLLHRKALCGLVTLWVILFFAFPLMNSAAELIVLSSAIALLLGWRLGSSDSGEDAEEFALALPPTRLDYFTVRSAAGVAVMLCFVLSGIIMSFASPLLWWLVVESGMIEVRFLGDLGWDLWHVSLFGVGLFVCCFSIARLLPRRITVLSIPVGVVLSCAWGFLGVCAYRYVGETYIGYFLGLTEVDFRLGWVAGCFGGGFVVWMLALIDAKCREYSARSGVLRCLLFVLLAILWGIVLLLVIHKNPEVLEGVLSIDFLIGDVQWRTTAVGLCLVLILAIAVLGGRRASLRTQISRFSQTTRLCARRFSGFVGFAGIAWLGSTHYFAVRDGYSHEAMDARILSFPMDQNAGDDGDLVYIVIYVTPVFAPDIPLAAVPIVVSPQDYDFSGQAKVTRKLRVAGEDLEIEVNLMNRPSTPLLRCGLAGGDTSEKDLAEFTSMDSAKINSWISCEVSASGFESLVPTSGDNGLGLVGVVVGRPKPGNVWRQREQGVSRTYRIWACACLNSFPISNEPAAVEIDSLIERALESGKAATDSNRMFKMNAFFLHPASLDATFTPPFKRLDGGGWEPLRRSASDLLHTFQWALVIGLAAVSLIAFSLRQRRKRVLVILILLLIGFFAILDRLSVRNAVEYIASPSATLYEKSVAASKLSRTFFWKRTALGALERARKDGAAGDGVTRIFDQTIEPMRLPWME